MGYKSTKQIFNIIFNYPMNKDFLLAWYPIAKLRLKARSIQERQSVLQSSNPEIIRRLCELRPHPRHVPLFNNNPQPHKARSLESHPYLQRTLKRIEPDPFANERKNLFTASKPIKANSVESRHGHSLLHHIEVTRSGDSFRLKSSFAALDDNLDAFFQLSTRQKTVSMPPFALNCLHNTTDISNLSSVTPQSEESLSQTSHSKEPTLKSLSESISLLHCIQEQFLNNCNKCLEQKKFQSREETEQEIEDRKRLREERDDENIDSKKQSISRHCCTTKDSSVGKVGAKECRHRSSFPIQVERSTEKKVKEAKKNEDCHSPQMKVKKNPSESSFRQCVHTPQKSIHSTQHSSVYDVEKNQTQFYRLQHDNHDQFIDHQETNKNPHLSFSNTKENNHRDVEIIKKTAHPFATLSTPMQNIDKIQTPKKKKKINKFEDFNQKSKAFQGDSIAITLVVSKNTFHEDMNNILFEEAQLERKEEIKSSNSLELCEQKHKSPISTSDISSSAEESLKTETIDECIQSSQYCIEEEVYLEISSQIEEVYNKITKEANENELRREMAFLRIKSLLHFTNIHLYGSCYLGLAIENSDVDIVAESKSAGVELTLSDFEGYLKHPSITYSKIISTAAIPILKLKVDTSMWFESWCEQTAHAGGTVDIDFTVLAQSGDNPHLGLDSSRQIEVWLKDIPDLHLVILPLKVYLVQRHLNDCYKNGIKTYAVIVMLVAAIKYHAIHLRSAGYILATVAHFYSVFDQTRYAIDLHRPEIFFLKDKVDRNSADIEIRDPLNPSRNITRNCYQYHAVKKLWTDIAAACRQIHLNIKQHITINEFKTLFR